MTWSAEDFDSLLNAILTDYQNQSWTDPETGLPMTVDVSQGSLVFIRSACLASALWGAYRHQDWIERQIHADTADAEHLEHHAWTRGVYRRSGETMNSFWRGFWNISGGHQRVGTPRTIANGRWRSLTWQMPM